MTQYSPGSVYKISQITNDSPPLYFIDQDDAEKQLAKYEPRSAICVKLPALVSTTGEFFLMTDARSTLAPKTMYRVTFTEIYGEADNVNVIHIGDFASRKTAELVASKYRSYSFATHCSIAKLMNKKH